MILTEDKTKFLETMIDLKSEVARLTNELEQMSKIVKMMNQSTETLDQILTYSSN